MQKRLSFKDYWVIGAMLFGIMFGAGNLIFPVHMGQEAGQQVWQAAGGFLVTAIGLPFLAIVGMGLTRSSSVYALASKAGRPFGLIFTVLLYLVIGPFFAIPRLATTSFEIGITPFIGAGQQGLSLALYSVFFFALAWILSQNASKLLDYVGKILTPIFLGVLGVLLALAVINPMGQPALFAPAVAYEQAAFVKGVLEGYNTLDVLAALAFAVLVISALKQLGVTDPKKQAIDMTKAGLLSMGLMGLIYVLLAFAGASSLGQLELSDNGGIALAQIAGHYLGWGGNVLLALIVFFGCLKTAVGLLMAFSETFAELFPRLRYQDFLLVATIFPALFANIGLTNIIAYSIPVLMFLYPLAMVLVFLALLDRFFAGDSRVYGMTLVFTLFPALLDGLATSPWKDLTGVVKLVGFGQSVFPFSDFGMAWVFPAVIGFVLGLVWTKLKP